MVIQLVPAEPHQVNELGRICFEAFKDVQEKHLFPPGFPSVALARKAIGMFVQRQDFDGVAALVDGKVVGLSIPLGLQCKALKPR